MGPILETNCRLFGENRLQEAEKKTTLLTGQNIEWHMIGHLQKNKVKKAVKLMDCIQSVDSLKLAKKISDEAKKENKTMRILLQVNSANDPNKHGLSEEEIRATISEFFLFPNLQIEGIMLMTPIEKEEDKLRAHFRNAKQLHDDLKTQYPSLTTLSMGMSQDYKIAIEEGATLVRIGRLILK